LRLFDTGGPKKLVKSQTQQEQEQEEEYSISNEEISESLLLRCWNKTLEPVYETIKINKESGVKYPERFVNYLDTAEPMDVKQKRRWLAASINIKTGEFHTLDQLLAAGKISKTEKKLFGDKQFPRRELTQMIRHQDDNKREWLVRNERWIGLTENGGVVSVPVNNIDFARQVVPKPDSVPQDPTVQGSPHVKILKIGPCLPSYETAEKIYLTPFTKENVLAAMQKAQRPSEPRLHGQISLILFKDNSHNPISAPDLDTFVNAPFDELWKQQTTPAPHINLNPKDLANYLKHDRESSDKDAYQ
jgi:hypothetical protein